MFTLSFDAYGTFATSTTLIVRQPQGYLQCINLTSPVPREHPFMIIAASSVVIPSLGTKTTILCASLVVCYARPKLQTIRTAARVDTRNLDRSKGGNGFRSLCRCGWWHSSLRHHAARRQ
jgi:hypothetical protein